MTIRSRIEAIREHLAKEDVSPSVARTSLIQITALLGNCMDEARHLDHEYKLVLLGCMAGGEPANKAKIRAEVTPQYVAWREAQDLVELVIELIRSLKASLKSKDEEMRFTPR